MKTTRIVPTILLFGFAVFAPPIQADDQQLARPGAINYVEGQAYLGTETLNGSSVGKVEVDPGETLATGDGKVEMLLTPGVFVRLGEQSSATMISSGLIDIRMSVDQGEALVEVAELHPENELRVVVDGKTTELVKTGLYDFNAGLHAVRVLDGEAMVEDAGGKRVKVKGGHMVDLGMGSPLKPRKFDKKQLEAGDLYRWTSLRSSYLAEANADSARTYSYGGFGWYGDGWYWDPWFDAYTFMPGDGIFYSPFGWGFYSPWCAYYAPYYGGGHMYHHFNPTARSWGQGAHYGLPANYGRGVHYGQHYGGGAMAARSGGSFSHGGGYRGGGGGGFHGGGSGGGGFHGGGGFGGGGGFHGGGGGGGGGGFGGGGGGHR